MDPEEQSRKKNRRKSIWPRLTYLAIFLFVLCYWLLPWCFPLPPDLVKPGGRSVVFTDLHGEPLRRLLDAGGEKSGRFVSYDEIPESLIQATVAAEDSRYFWHGGIDFAGVVRAGIDSILEGKMVSGASTITQQLVKISSPPAPRNLVTKLREMTTARRLEMSFSKEEILTEYFNRLPYGNQFRGCHAAAEGYFGKPLSDLSLLEASFLAGLPNKPTTYNPWRNFDAARRRQDYVLRRMKEEGVLDSAEFSKATTENVNLLPRARSPFGAPHFVDLLLQRHPDAAKIASSSRKTIRTTLDRNLQIRSERIVHSELLRIAQVSREEDDLQAALVVIENKSGAIRTLVGSRSFFHSASGQINGAWHPRSAGSTLKPFTYLMALRAGSHHAASIVADTPIEYVTSTGNFQPVNFDRSFRGPVTIRQALAQSLNVPAVKILQEIGGPSALGDFLQREVSFSSLHKTADEYGLGLTIGNAEVRLVELTNAYAALARLGEYRDWQLLAPSASESTGPNPVESPTQQGIVEDSTLLCDESIAWLIADILSDNQARAGAFGLNSPLRLPFRTAAKTGTSTDFRDNWALGYTPEFTVGVWVGRFNNKPLRKLSGVMGAGPIFHEVMKLFHEEVPASWYPAPPGLRREKIDLLNGKIIPPDFAIAPTRQGTEFFLQGQPLAPLLARIEDYSSNGKTLLNAAVYGEWWQLSKNQNTLRGAATLNKTPALISADSPNATLRITSPLTGTIAYLDPDLPNGGRRFPLRVSTPSPQSLGEIQWSSDTLQVETKQGRAWAILEPGTHRITATHPDTGLQVSSEIRVEAY